MRRRFRNLRKPNGRRTAGGEGLLQRSRGRRESRSNTSHVCPESLRNLGNRHLRDSRKTLATVGKLNSVHMLLAAYDFMMVPITKWLQLALLAAALFQVPACRANARAQKSCTEDEAKRALNESDRLKDWNAVYASFKRFAHCDDGAIAEGYSDTVGRLLSKDWANVYVLTRLVTSDETFKRFVLGHLDETLPEDELKQVAHNARARCPSGRTEFCKLISARLREIGVEPK
jgi:hypothetical protein